MQLLNKIGQQRSHFPIDTIRILNTRSLRSGHQRLVELIQPGMTVLDIGCGPGSITCGIAETVVPNGRVVGIDTNYGFIEEARHNHSDISNLSFEVGDIYNLSYSKTFDIVIAARIFHWLSRPLEALEMMIKYTKPGGRILVHEPNLEKVVWQPEPPNSFKVFYNAFLEWRAEVGMDNTIADKLSRMFKKSGLINVVETPQHEITRYTDSNFETRIGIWDDVMNIQGLQMVQDSVITEKQRLKAKVDYREWVLCHAKSQNIYFIAFDGVLQS